MQAKNETTLLRVSTRDRVDSGTSPADFSVSSNNGHHTHDITSTEPIMVSYSNTFKNIKDFSSVTVVYSSFDGQSQTTQLAYPGGTYIDASDLLTGLNTNCRVTGFSNASSVFTQDAVSKEIKLVITNTPSSLGAVAGVQLLVTGTLANILGFSVRQEYVESSLVVTHTVNFGVMNFLPTAVVYVEISYLADAGLTEPTTGNHYNVICAIPNGHYARGTYVHWEPSCAGQYKQEYAQPHHLDKVIRVRLLDDRFQVISMDNNSHVDMVFKLENKSDVY